MSNFCVCTVFFYHTPYINPFSFYSSSAAFLLFEFHFILTLHLRHEPLPLVDGVGQLRERVRQLAAVNKRFEPLGAALRERN